MVAHIVLFKLRDSSEAEKNKVKELLDSMANRVPMIRKMEVGSDFLGSARSYDIALTVYVDDCAALGAYQRDPYHCGVVKAYMNEATAASVACDYEI